MDMNTSGNLSVREHHTPRRLKCMLKFCHSTKRPHVSTQFSRTKVIWTDWGKMVNWNFFLETIDTNKWSTVTTPKRKHQRRRRREMVDRSSRPNSRGTIWFVIGAQCKTYITDNMSVFVRLRWRFAQQRNQRKETSMLKGICSHLQGSCCIFLEGNAKLHAPLISIAWHYIAPLWSTGVAASCCGAAVLQEELVNFTK